MARLESKKKMGYYPTPDDTLLYIKRWLNIDPEARILDPCCGDGYAVASLGSPRTFGVELDPERARKAGDRLNVITGSIYQTVIRPLESFSLLYLNPPYDYEDGQRAEIRFLKHAHKWLIPGGILVYLVPEHIFDDRRFRNWLSKRYRDIRIFRFTRDDYPRFKQVVLFAKKSEDDIGEEELPAGPYKHIEDVEPDEYYYVPSVATHLSVFEMEGVSLEEIHENKDRVMKAIKEVAGHLDMDSKILSPIFPLRKGHLLALLTSGVLNGAIRKGDDEIIFKSYCERIRVERKEEGKDIETDTYASGIRVIEKGRWYDVR